MYLGICTPFPDIATHNIYGLHRSLKLTARFYFKELCTEINRTASPGFRVKMEKLGNFFLPIATVAIAATAYFNYLTDRTDYFAEIDYQQPILSSACNLRDLSHPWSPSVTHRAVTLSKLDCRKSNVEQREHKQRQNIFISNNFIFYS